MFKKIQGVFLSILLFSFFSFSVFSATLHVPSNYSSIQAAINASSNGDTILVGPGTYNEDINFNGKAVELKSSGGPEVTTILGTGTNSVVKAISGEGTNTILDGFTVTGGTGSLWLGDSTLVGGGMRIQNQSSPTVKNCIFKNNTAMQGAGIWAYSGGPQILDSTFENNQALGVSTEGAGMKLLGSWGLVSNCRFINNEVQSFGGGIHIQSGYPYIVNSLFYGNSAGFGGAINNQAGIPSIINSTVSGNSSNFGGGIRSNAGTVYLKNSILWENSSDEIYLLGGAILNTNYSNISGGWGDPDFNFDYDPQFMDPENGDFRLQETSPLINTGSNELYYGNPEGSLDLDGNPRLVGDNIDLGPYEFQGTGLETCQGDLNDDGLVDSIDFLELLSAWGVNPGHPADFDQNGLVETIDMLTLLSNWGECN